MPLALILSRDLDSVSFNLYNRAKKANWDPKDVVPRSARPDLAAPADLEFRWALASGHVYAEQTGMVIAAMLVQETGDAAARLGMATATADEAKHAEVFARYATLLGGEVKPPTDTEDGLYQGLRAIADPYSRFLTHTMLEWMALDEFALLKKLFAHDPLGGIYASVRRDEARHVAMGLQYLYRESPGRSAAELEMIAQRGLELVGLSTTASDCSDENIGATLGFLDEGLGLGPGGTTRFLLNRHRRRLASVIAICGR